VGLLRFVRAQWDRVAGAACGILGVVALVFGWAQVSNEVYPAAQFPYLISCGAGGLFLLGVGATLWLSADLRDEWRHLDRLEERVTARVEARLAERAAVRGASHVDDERTTRAPVVPAGTRT